MEPLGRAAAEPPLRRHAVSGSNRRHGVEPPRQPPHAGSDGLEPPAADRDGCERPTDDAHAVLRSLAKELGFGGNDPGSPGDAAELRRLGEYVCRVVPREDLAKLAQRLTRRTVGLGGLWERLCASQGCVSDPSTAEAAVLLRFVCLAIALEPGRVVSVKGPHQPVMGVAVYLAQSRQQALGSAASSPDSVAVIGNSTAAACATPRGLELAMDTRQKEDSTRSGSVDSKDSKADGSVGSSAGVLDPARSIASVSWLGPDPSTGRVGAESAAAAAHGFQ